MEVKDQRSRCVISYRAVLTRDGTIQLITALRAAQFSRKCARYAPLALSSPSRLGTGLSGLRLLKAPAQVGDACKRDPLHIRALPAAIPPELQFLDLRHPETEVARPPHETQHVHVVRRVVAIAGRGPASLGNQAALLTVPDHLGADAGSARRLANVYAALGSRQLGRSHVDSNGFEIGEQRFAPKRKSRTLLQTGQAIPRKLKTPPMPAIW